MSDDLREDILARIFDVLGTISGAASVWRNRDSLNDDEISSLPALILLDGREEQEGSLREQQVTRKFKVQTSTIMRIFPEVVVQLYPRITPQQLYVSDPLSVSNGQRFDPPGPELSRWRMTVMRAIMSDITLVGQGRTGGLITETGSIHYLGSETDYRISAPMTGMMMVGFEIRYPLQQFW